MWPLTKGMVVFSDLVACVLCLTTSSCDCRFSSARFSFIFTSGEVHSTRPTIRPMPTCPTILYLPLRPSLLRRNILMKSSLPPRNPSHTVVAIMSSR